MSPFTTQKGCSEMHSTKLLRPSHSIEHQSLDIVVSTESIFALTFPPVSLPLSLASVPWNHFPSKLSLCLPCLWVCFRGNQQDKITHQDVCPACMMGPKKVPHIGVSHRRERRIYLPGFHLPPIFHCSKITPQEANSQFFCIVSSSSLHTTQEIWSHVSRCGVEGWPPGVGADWYRERRGWIEAVQYKWSVLYKGGNSSWEARELKVDRAWQSMEYSYRGSIQKLLKLGSDTQKRDQSWRCGFRNSQDTGGLEDWLRMRSLWKAQRVRFKAGDPRRVNVQKKRSRGRTIWVRRRARRVFCSRSQWREGRSRWNAVRRSSRMQTEEKSVLSGN